MAIARPVLCAAFVGAAATLAMAFPTRANIIFDFNGACTVGCIGTATGVLTLSDSYVFGTDVTFADFISLSYSSSSFNFDIVSLNGPIFIGGLNFDGSFDSTGALTVELPAGFPNFSAMPGQFTALPDDEEADQGAVFSFSFIGGPVPEPVPEPSTWVTMLLGYAGFGYARYRKARQAAVVPREV